MAAIFFVTAVVCARVVIEADDGIAHARSRFAVIALGASVTVQALALIERFMSASILAATDILRAWITIVTGAVVDKSIAVVIDAIAAFRFCRFYIAGG